MPRVLDSQQLSRRQSGFTLLELMVVFFIIGLLLTIATPYLGFVHNAHLKSQVRRLAARSAFLFDKAATHKLVIRLTFDISRSQYFVSKLDPYSMRPVFAPDLDPGSEPVAMPDDVRIRDVFVQGTGTLKRGTISCLFFPEGYVDETIVHMESSSGDIFTLKLDSFSGRAMIRRGNIPLKRALAMMP